MDHIGGRTGDSVFAGMGYAPAVPRAYRDATLDDALPAHLKALAAETEGRGRARIRMPRGLLGSLERSVRFLNALPAQDLLPAARWLCDNGRFLQEEIASLRLALEGAPRLPRCSSGTPRVCLFARELMGHSAAAFDRGRLERAVDAWQSVTPFTVEETDCLPLALRLTLLELICLSANQCMHEQQGPASAPFGWTSASTRARATGPAPVQAQRARIRLSGAAAIPGSCR